MRFHPLALLLAALLAVVAIPNHARAQDEAAQAWARGDMATAERLYSARLARDPADQVALHRMALVRARAGRYDESLRLLDRLLALAPDNLEAAMDRARVLSWASRFREAAAVYDSLLRVNPNDRDALLGLARVLAWEGRRDSASAIYGRILAADPANADARRGMARTHAWSGRLVRAEEEWRRVLAAEPGDPAALVGLSQTLRWQGRDAAALEAAERAVRAAPTDRDVRTELGWARLPTRPRTGPSFVHESDSDGNRVATTAVSAGWRPVPRLELRGEGYLRQARQEEVADEFDARAQGAALTLWTQVEPGWSFSGTAGVSTSDVEGADPVGTFRAALSTPARHRATATLALSRQAVDWTALLVQRQVVGDEVSLSTNFAPAQGWTLSGGAGGARFHGRVSDRSNTRWNASGAVARQLSRLFTLGVAARAFGWERDLDDGYFDPDFYGLGEVTARLLRDTGRWVLNAEVAPGYQQVRRDGDPSRSFRASGGLAYVFGPGRQLGLTAAYANSGAQSLSPTGGSDYTYQAFGVTGSWAF